MKTKIKSAKPTATKPKSAKKGERQIRKPQPQDLWSQIERNHGRCVRLGQFFDIAYPPKVTDVEVVVCFADLRGFTSYCHALQKASLDNRIQNFLKDYFSIYSLSVLEEIWRLEPDNERDGMDSTAAEIKDIVVPVTYKNLGDGVMLVWEIPPGSSKAVQGMATHSILQVVLNVYNQFVERFHELTDIDVDAYSEKVRQLRIGFGLARGHAWKLDFGHHVKPDYAGSVVNLAARLQDHARPEGIVCQYEFSQSCFEMLQKKKLGKSSTLKTIKGIGKQKVYILSPSEIKKNIDDYWLEGSK